jgi:hypothetical protein
MSSDIEQLQRDVQLIKDRMAILDCISRHSRGHDRHDSALIASAYHADGVDEHGPYVNPASTYPDWVNAAHEAGMSLHSHNITTHNCEIDGDIAYADSYVIACLLSHDQKTAIFASGRYIDQLERRRGEWKITVRRTTMEVAMTGDASFLHSKDVKGYLKGTWGKDDPTYARPVKLNPADVRW